MNLNNSSQPATELKSAVVPVWSSTGVVAAVSAIVLAVVLGFLAAAHGLFVPTTNTSSASSTTVTPIEITPTGETTEVTVTANKDMTFTPNRIEVPLGNKLVITLKNADPLSGHDLSFGEKATKRLQPGESEVLDLGIVSENLTGTCTVAGHAQMGMQLEVVVTGVTAGANSNTASEHHSEAENGTQASAVGNIPAVPDAKLQDFVDPKLEPLKPKTEGPQTHEITLTVTETPLEIAPGLYQTRWTYNGKSVGPTLHGRVGDKFKVTLVNDGSIGHSVDFHAGVLAPDKPMRTIAPGEKLEYVFTAERAGVWMYHCSTMPMSSHIAAGMHGAVVIEPEDLDPVDHEFILVQSEVYLANAAHSAQEAKELDAAKILAGQPDRTVFNGIANQYVENPFRVKVGERVRFWVLDAGPNVALAFHIVGGQFDTVWTEGAYQLRNGKAADLRGGETTDGGAQVLSLLAAQGGFVELEFPEAGNYAVVNHIMSEAERGAKGIVRVE